MDAARSDDHIRLAELIASLSLATDLGLGQPLEHELGVCLSALELADRLGCAAEESSDVYYVALLAHVGCTAAAPYFASWVGRAVYSSRPISCSSSSSSRIAIPYRPVSGISGFRRARLSSTAPAWTAASRKPRR